jgi:hypothetical protein
MATASSSAAGVPRPGRSGDGDRLGRRDLLVLRLELERLRRTATSAAAAQRSTRNTR